MDGKVKVDRYKITVVVDGNLDPVWEGRAYVAPTDKLREEVVRALHDVLEGIPSEDINVERTHEYGVIMPEGEVDFVVKLAKKD